jgi:hypothetical protein
VKELSVFVDESGDFGEYEIHAPYYLLALLFHEQSDDICEQVAQFQQTMTDSKLTLHTIHMGPMIRREGFYFNFTKDERKSIYRKMLFFTRNCPIRYRTFDFSKRELGGGDKLILKMSQTIGAFLREHLEYFQSFDRIVVYYDNGQHQVTRILLSVFGAYFTQGLEIKRAEQADYHLAQAADFLCTLELIDLKRKAKMISKSEELFFDKAKREFANTMKIIRRKLF